MIIAFLILVLFAVAFVAILCDVDDAIREQQELDRLDDLWADEGFKEAA